MEPSDILSLSILLKIDVESGSLDNFTSTVASNFLDGLTKSGEVNFCISPTFGLALRPQGEEVPKIPIRDWEEFSTMRLALQMSPGVLPSTPVLLTCHGFM